MAVTPDGRLAVSASGDQTLKVWDVESGRELRTLTGHSESSQWRGGERRRAAGGLRVWGPDAEGVGRRTSGRELRTLRTGHSWFCHGVAVSAGRAAGGLGV